MFIQLKHKNLDVYAIRELVKQTYKVSLKLPSDERFNMVQQIRRVAISAKLNMAEGSTRKSFAERKRFFEISRGSLVEIDAVLETAIDLKYFVTDELQEVGALLNRCFAMLSKMVGN